MRTNTIGMILATAVSTSVASAAVVLNYSSGFEDATLGAAGLNNPAGWELGSANINIVDVGGTHGKVLEFTSTASSWSKNVKFAEVTDTILTVEFKVRLAAGSNGTAVRFGGVGTAGQTGYLRLEGGGGGNGVFSYHSASGFTNLMTGIVKGHWYNVTQTYNLAAKTYDISIVDLDNTSQNGTWANLGYTSLGAGTKNKMDTFTIVNTATANNSFMIDDVKITVPEPTLMAPLGLAGLLALRRRRHG